MSAAPVIPTRLSTDQLKAAVAAQLPELVAIRRHLHAHPELSGNEHQTAALVAGELRSLGWRVREGVGRTGVLAELGPTGSDTPLVALRVDMDALPVEAGTFIISKILLRRSYARCEEPHKFLGLCSEFLSNVLREQTHLQHHGNPIH